MVGSYKVNTDVAFDGANNRIGVDIIVRNNEGLVMGSSVQLITACFCPQVAEAMAMLR